MENKFIDIGPEEDNWICRNVGIINNDYLRWNTFPISTLTIYWHYWTDVWGELLMQLPASYY